MGSVRTRGDAKFWEVVDGLEGRLDDSGDGPPPRDGPEFFRGGGGGVWPRWATHVIAFMLGGLTWGCLLLAPLMLPVAALAAVIGFVAFAAGRRWR